MVRKQGEYSLDHEQVKRMIMKKFSRVPAVRLQYESTRGHTRELRICAKTCYDWAYVEMSEWTLKKDDRWARTGRVTLSPYCVLSSVVKALKLVVGPEEIWVPKRPSPDGGDPDLIRIVLETDGRDQCVEVRTWTLGDWGYKPTAKGVTIPLHLLPGLIDGLEPFAEAVRRVNRYYVRPVFVAAPERFPLFEYLHRLSDLATEEDPEE